MIQREGCPLLSSISHFGNWEGWGIFSLDPNLSASSDHLFSLSPTQKKWMVWVQTLTLPPKVGNHFWNHLQGSSQLCFLPSLKTYSAVLSLCSSISPWMAHHISLPNTDSFSKTTCTMTSTGELWSGFPELASISWQHKKRSIRHLSIWFPAVPVSKWDDGVSFLSL